MYRLGVCGKILTETVLGLVLGIAFDEVFGLLVLDCVLGGWSVGSYRPEISRPSDLIGSSCTSWFVFLSPSYLVVSWLGFGLFFSK